MTAKEKGLHVQSVTMQCPKCGFEQNNNRSVCGACGIIFAKYHAAKKRLEHRPIREERRKTYKQRRGFLTWPFRILFYGSALLLMIGYFQQDKFVDDLQIGKQLLHEPIQKQTRQQSFSVSQKGVDYKIEPLFDYEISGLVVSYRHHGDGLYSIHNRLWNDHINVSDLCVVWADNATKLDLNQFTFWNESFTCNIKTENMGAWEKFKMNQLSNNHVVTADDVIRDKIAQARIGDQIHIKGMLSNYSTSKGGTRGTSTTRDDRGNGACETIFVKEFEIIKSMDNIWRPIMTFAWFGILISCISGFIGLLRD